MGTNDIQDSKMNAAAYSCPTCNKDLTEAIKLIGDADTAVYLHGIAHLRDENRDLTKRIAGLQFVRSCVWCGYAYPVAGKTGNEAMQILREHDETCTEHPAVKRVNALRDVLFPIKAD
jgi:hypothetical protein